MKCDELKPLVYSLKDLSYVDETAVENNFDNPHDHAVYKATEVDAAIAELKAKLESVQASMYADAVDLGMEIRKLKRALWIARAELCRRFDVDRYLRNHRNSLYNEEYQTFDKVITMELKMCKAECKCRAKSEQYK